MNGFGRPDRHRRQSFTMATHLGASKSDLEQDSGFSDASSEYLSAVELTDSEDVGRNGSVINQLPVGQQLALMGGSYAGLSQMIIMNNFMLKQPSNMAPAEKQWGISSPMEVMPPSQVVLLQPVLSSGNSSSPKAGCENTRQSRSYTPVLKSYPRIAPHPGELLSKRVGSSRLRGAQGYEQRQRKHHHSHRVYSAPSPQPTLQAPIQQSNNYEAVNNQAHVPEIQAKLCEKSISSLTGISSVSTYTHEFQTVISNNTIGSEKCEDAFMDDGTKLKRFSNTYNILNKSGLLGITMRTKQLIKENRRTQSQLLQLQEQTSLMLEALSSGDSQLWAKLQLSLQDTDKEKCPVKAPTLLV